jgi:hypothetical protein
MSLGNLFSSLAPVAAGFMTGGSSLAFAPLLAGAATGAGIAALRNEDPLMGAVTGGIGGYGGGELGRAAAGVGAGAGSAIPARTTTLPSGMVEKGLGSSVGFTGPKGLEMSTVNMPAIGTAPPTYSATTAAKNLFTNPGGVISNLGGGDISKGALKAGAIGLPAVAGAMVPDMPRTTGEMNQMRYDPNRPLNLNRPTGLRLQEGGFLPYEFRDSTTMDPERFRMFMMQREMRGPREEIVYEEGLQALENERARMMRDPQVVENERARVMRRIDPNVGTEKESRDRFNSLMEAFEAERQMIKNMPEGPEKERIMRMNDNFSRDEFYFNQGGYLETGMGDGVSDEIPASLDGQQDILLSENEFVIPADVVSGLGNGSSDAGAEKLYDMMDRVRKARTGTEKMGREITAERLMPA